MRDALLVIFLSFAAAGANAQEAPIPLPMDTPSVVAGLDMACSGIGEEAQLDDECAALVELGKPLHRLVEREGQRLLRRV